MRGALLAVVIAVLGLVRPASSAVILPSGSTDLQTLISTGDNGVVVGTERYFDFSFATVGSAAAVSPGAVTVEPINFNASGLRFISPWYVSNGSSISAIISYSVESTIVSMPTTNVSLFGNGTAPSTSPGTFVSATMTVQNPANGSNGSILTIYNDGLTYPLDTTQPTNNSAATSVNPADILAVTDSLTLASSSDGVATATVLENSFTQVPEPCLAGAMILVLSAGRRRRFSDRTKEPSAV